MPGRTDNLNIFNDNDSNNNNSSTSNNSMDPIEHGGNAIYTFQAMSGSNPDRYLSNESLETNSSGESNLGNIQHRKVGRCLQGPIFETFYDFKLRLYSLESNSE